jgi:hypothetical protein
MSRYSIFVSILNIVLSIEFQIIYYLLSIIFI